MRGSTSRRSAYGIEAVRLVVLDLSASMKSAHSPPACFDAHPSPTGRKLPAGTARRRQANGKVANTQCG